MNLKNLLLTFGICCTTVGSALSIKPKITTTVNAADNNGAILSSTGLNKYKFIEHEEAIWHTFSAGTININNRNRVNADIDQYYIMHRDEENYLYYSITIVKVTAEQQAEVTITPNWNKTQTFFENATTKFMTDNTSVQSNIEQTLDQAYDWDEYLSISEYKTTENYYNWDPTSKIGAKLQARTPNMYVYINAWGIQEETTNENEPAFTPYTTYAYTGNIYNGIVTTSEIVDIPGLMLQIISMPFTFISTAFDLTLFPNTPYQVNIGNFILGVIAILTVLFIIKIFTGGLDIIGNVTNSARDNSTERIRRNTAKVRSQRKNTAAKNANNKTKEK